MDKFRRAEEMIRASAPHGFEILPVEPCPEDDLRRVHSAEYLEKIRTNALNGLESFKLGLPCGEELLTRSRLEVAGTIAAMHAAGRPILAECGGMMCLAESLTLTDGTSHVMFGLLPAEVTMQTRLAAIGLQEAELPEGSLRGHTFHYSKISTAMTPLARATGNRDGAPGEAMYRTKRLTASYVHLYFASNPEAAAALFLP